MDRITAFGNQLVITHIALREHLARLRDGSVTGADLRAHCLTFCSVLAGHHEAEDDGGFPVLAKQYPELAPVLTELSNDHRLVEAALTRLTELSTMDSATARTELDTLAALLETHFTYEERTLVAALNALRPNEEDAATVLRAVTID
jgi:hypothetical protein